MANQTVQRIERRSAGRIGKPVERSAARVLGMIAGIGRKDLSARVVVVVLATDCAERSIDQTLKCDERQLRRLEIGSEIRPEDAGQNLLGKLRLPSHIERIKPVD
jgi:hypothetical protein